MSYLVNSVVVQTETMTFIPTVNTTWKLGTSDFSTWAQGTISKIQVTKNSNVNPLLINSSLSPTYNQIWQTVTPPTSTKIRFAGQNIWTLVATGNSNQTFINGASGGTLVCSMPFQGAIYKKVVLYYDAVNGACAAYTFPVAFSQIPGIVITSSGPAASTCSATATAATVSTGVATSGFLFLEGY